MSNNKFNFYLILIIINYLLYLHALENLAELIDTSI